MKNAFQLLTHNAVTETGNRRAYMITLYLYCFLKE